LEGSAAEQLIFFAVSIVDLLLGVPYFVTDLLLGVPYFYSETSTYSLACHILGRLTPWRAIFWADFLLDVPYFYSETSACSLACHIFTVYLLLGMPYFGLI
jgi:hypothetical protein